MHWTAAAALILISSQFSHQGEHNWWQWPSWKGSLGVQTLLNLNRFFQPKNLV